MSTAFTAAKIVGLTGAAWLSGTIASMSLISIPAISRCIKEDNLPATDAVKLWRANFNAGFALAPPTALATAASLSYCAWSTWNISAHGLRNPRLFLVAAALTVSVVPYTIVTMTSTNDKLMRFAKKGEKEELSANESGESEELLQRWTTLNLVRSLLPLSGAIVAGMLVLA